MKLTGRFHKFTSKREQTSWGVASNVQRTLQGMPMESVLRKSFVVASLVKKANLIALQPIREKSKLLCLIFL